MLPEIRLARRSNEELIVKNYVNESKGIECLDGQYRYCWLPGVGITRVENYLTPLKNKYLKGADSHIALVTVFSPERFISEFIDIFEKTHYKYTKYMKIMISHLLYNFLMNKIDGYKFMKNMIRIVL